MHYTDAKLLIVIAYFSSVASLMTTLLKYSTLKGWSLDRGSAESCLL